MLDSKIGLFMGINSVTETELNLESLRALRESRTKVKQDSNPELEAKDQVLASNSRFGQNSPSPQVITANQADSKNTWSQVGAKIINTQNFSADKGQDMGRDNLELKTHALDGQLDNKENTFISFTDNNGIKHEAFRSKNTLGVYYGVRQSGDINWQTLKSEELQKNLDQIHEQKLRDIDSTGGYENYQALQKDSAEINDLKDLYHNAKLDSSRREAFKQIQSGKDLKLIKEEHPEISADLLMDRFTKIASVSDDDQIKVIKANFENELTKLGAKATDHGYDFSQVNDKETLKINIGYASAMLDMKIDDLRNSAQRLDSKEQAEYDQISAETKHIMQALAANNPELEKLHSRYKELAQPLDPNQGKYSLNQLRAFRAQVEQSSSSKIIEKTFNNDAELFKYLKTMPNDTRLAARNGSGSVHAYITKDAQGNVYKDDGSLFAVKLDPNNKYVPSRSSDKFIIQENDNGNYAAYKVNFRYSNSGSEIMTNYNEATNARKVFTAIEENGNKKYLEIQARKIDQANIDAYKIKDGSEDKYYIFPAGIDNKATLWELKVPNGQYGLISASQSSFKPDGYKSAEIDGIIFHFDQNGYPIGIAAKQDRNEGLYYNLEQLRIAKHRAFNSSF